MLERVRPRAGHGFAALDRGFAGAAFRLPTGVPGRDLPPRFGPWQRPWALPATVGAAGSAVLPGGQRRHDPGAGRYRAGIVLAATPGRLEG